jgi:hypothetical protein
MGAASDNGGAHAARILNAGQTKLCNRPAERPAELEAELRQRDDKITELLDIPLDLFYTSNR